MNELLMPFLTKIFGASEGDLKTLLYETKDGVETLKTDALQALVQRDAQRIETLKGIVKTDAYNDAYKKATFETRSNVEKTLTEKLGVKGSNFDEILSEVVKKVETPKAANETDVKKSSVFLEFEAAKKAEFDALTQNYEAKLNDLQLNFKRNETLKVAKLEGSKVFRSLNLNLPKDAVKAANIENDFLTKLDGFDFEPQNDGKILLLRNAKRVEDAHGNPIFLNDFVTKTALDFFDVIAQEPRTSSGNVGTQQNNGGVLTVVAPKDDEEFAIAILQAQSDEQKTAIVQAYKSKN